MITNIHTTTDETGNLKEIERRSLGQGKVDSKIRRICLVTTEYLAYILSAERCQSEYEKRVNTSELLMATEFPGQTLI